MGSNAEMTGRGSVPARPVPRSRARHLSTVAAGAVCALLDLACAQASAPTVPRPRSLAETHAREQWIVRKLRDLRAAERTEDERVRAIRSELERAGVDWRSFLTPVRGSTEGSWHIYGEGFKNHTLRQLAQKLNLVRDVRQILGLRDAANDLARDGSVLDSAFFTNRDVAAISPDEMRRELEAQAPRGAITMVEEKSAGSSEGFIGKDAKGDLFIFVLDPPAFPEMSTAAEVIGSTILRLAGYNVPYPTIVTLDDLRLDPESTPDEGLTRENVRRFEGRRAVATRMIAKGYRGPWTYAVFRDRRELRALGVFGTWLNNPDQVDHNTLIEVFDEQAGLARYFVIDFSGALGASSARVKDPQDGWINNHVDLHWGLTLPLRILAQPFGYEKPWDPHQPIASPAVGRFDANLDPRLWKPYYPNLAYEDMDEEDARWAARIVGRFSDEMLEAIVALARYSKPADAAYVARTLRERRDIIVETYVEDGRSEDAARSGARRSR